MGLHLHIHLCDLKTQCSYLAADYKPYHLLGAGVILGLACSSSAMSKSRPAPPNAPESLHPIPIQLEQVHFEWIDRFPLPKLRHRMIHLSDVINTEEFMADLFTTQTFTIQPGRPSWDSDAWKVTSDFKQKWIYLF
jgi:hypothetical protein